MAQEEQRLSKSPFQEARDKAQADELLRVWKIINRLKLSPETRKDLNAKTKERLYDLTGKHYVL